MTKKHIFHKGRLPRDYLVEQIHSVLGTSVFASQRKIYLFGDIEENALYRFQVALDTLDTTEGPIVIILSSGGGSVECGMAIYDAIKFCKNHVKIIGTGKVMSIAAAIMQAGDERYMMPEARFMIHNGELDFAGPVDGDKIGAIAKEWDATNERYAEILATRSGRPLKTIKNAIMRETYYSASEAVEAGFADGVLMPEGA